MSAEHLRVIAFCVYLAAWAAFAILALARGVPRRGRRPSGSTHITMSALAGMLMQGTSALPITLTLRDAPIRPSMPELIGTIALAPIAVGWFYWALWSVSSDTASDTLVTSGAYSWLRHPIYLAFLAMLLATGLVVSAGLPLIAAIALYVAGTELRIASEEAELLDRFPVEYSKYQRKTRWRYLPGLR